MKSEFEKMAIRSLAGQVEQLRAVLAYLVQQAKLTGQPLTGHAIEVAEKVLRDTDVHRENLGEDEK